MRVIFTKVAENSYERVLQFLSETWTEKEIEIFVSDTENIINQLEKGKYLMFQKSPFKSRSALIGKKHIRVFFKKEGRNLIKVLLFFDMRQDPIKILQILK
ncbi:hypothetical protein NZ698_13265 [Chryseobacterium sp. PBS4-4]|uniref:Type II toxin-antitoxin system RelE/ParE family toxin n=1 Tax=Chryseobacterium edaphi TaxID=2976532 RepID=A0ABT2W7I5_9FLAO|nr:hypothetical protein [Chryseobacterium edaphi]MCU7618172.1 hypothetical protein [Chryseobacterium edaphi]